MSGRLIFVRPGEPPIVYSPKLGTAFGKVSIMIDLIRNWDMYNTWERRVLAERYRITFSQLLYVEQVLAESSVGGERPDARVGVSLARAGSATGR